MQYEFEYKAKDGHTVAIKPNESYILVSKTNEHWWHVRRDPHTKPFYVPALYVKELAAPPAASDAARQTHRFSTFGFCHDGADVKLWETQDHDVCSRPRPGSKVRNGPKQPKGLLQPQMEGTVDDAGDRPPPPKSPVCDTIPEITVTDLDTFPDPPSPVAFGGFSGSQVRFAY